MPNNSWQFDSDTNSYHKQVGQYDFEANRHGVLRIYSGENLEVEHSTRNLLAAKEDAEYFLKNGSLPEPVQDIQQYQQPYFQPVAYGNPQVEIAAHDYSFRKFVLKFIGAIIVLISVFATGGYTLVSMQFSYGKHGTAVWMHTIATPIYVVVAVGTLYYLITRGFRR